MVSMVSMVSGVSMVSAHRSNSRRVHRPPLQINSGGPPAGTCARNCDITGPRGPTGARSRAETQTVAQEENLHRGAVGGATENGNTRRTGAQKKTRPRPTLGRWEPVRRGPRGRGRGPAGQRGKWYRPHGNGPGKHNNDGPARRSPALGGKAPVSAGRADTTTGRRRFRDNGVADWRRLPPARAGRGGPPLGWREGRPIGFGCCWRR